MFNKKLTKNIKINAGSNPSLNLNLQKLRHNRTFFTLISILLALLLVSSIVYITTFNGNSPFVSASPNVIVDNESGLRAALDDALDIAPNQYVIALDADIQLTTSALTLHTNTNVVLVNADNTPRKLIDANGANTITVPTGSTVVLDGIIVTHNPGDLGRVGVC